MYLEVLTDPAHHDPENFCYIVHGINPVSVLDLFKLTPEQQYAVFAEELEWKIKSFTNPRLFYNASLVGILEGAAHTRTFSPFGVIIAPPYEDSVVIAASRDLGSPTNYFVRALGENTDFEEFVERFRGYHRPVNELLHGRNYNHLILQGDPDTRIAGVYYTRFDQVLDDVGVMWGKTAEKIVGRSLPVAGLPFLGFV